ncbi:MAG TPA: 5-formyltetrahydrofolate cyclo-ligase [Pseudonocardiaceae bacterium]
MSTADPAPEIAKVLLRRRLSTARATVSPAIRAAEAAALATALPAALSASAPFPASAASAASAAPPPRSPGTVCAYWPVGTEPGSPALIDWLLRHGWRVLLPVVSPSGPLDWAQYTGAGSLRAGPLGLREPGGSRLGCAAIAGAAVVLVPALAVDLHGVRLGRGGGHYDRTLPLATPGTPLVAVVRDDELLARLPAQPHDVRVSAVLTPGAGWRPLPAP